MTGETEGWSAELKAHLKEVSDWLDANVQVIEAADRVTLRDFRWDGEEDRTVAFVLGVERQGDHSCCFGGNDAGDLQLILPLFHSPLGAPASYRAVELAPEVELAVLTGLRTIFPGLKPHGTDPATGRQILVSTSLRDRLGVPLEAVRDPLLREGLEVSVDVATLEVIVK